MTISKIGWWQENGSKDVKIWEQICDNSYYY